MAEPQLESLLAPLAADAPCGPDLEYDPAFQAMLDAGAGKPERQYGDKVYPAEPPDWPLVHEQALQLAARTRDLRVAVWLARSSARLHGLVGAVDGLQPGPGAGRASLGAGPSAARRERQQRSDGARHGADGARRIRSPASPTCARRALTGKRGALDRARHRARPRRRRSDARRKRSDRRRRPGSRCRARSPKQPSSARRCKPATKRRRRSPSSLERHIEASQAPTSRRSRKSCSASPTPAGKAAGDASVGEDAAAASAPAARARRHDQLARGCESRPRARLRMDRAQRAEQSGAAPHPPRAAVDEQELH